MANEISLPFPLLAAWITLVTRPDLTDQMTNPQHPSYSATLALYQIVGPLQDQWKLMVAVIAKNAKIRHALVDIGAAWSDIRAAVKQPDYGGNNCPPLQYLTAIAALRAAAAANSGNGTR